MTIINFQRFRSHAFFFLGSCRRIVRLSNTLVCIKTDKKFLQALGCSDHISRKKECLAPLFCRGYSVNNSVFYLQHNIAGYSVRHHGDTGNTSDQWQRSVDDVRFLEDLSKLGSCNQIFKMISSVGKMTETMVCAALLRIVQVETLNGIQLNPSDVFENAGFKIICVKLEQDSQKLSTACLVSVLKGLVQLRVDPCSPLMVRLLSESQERVDSTEITIQNLCTLGESLLGIEGPERAKLQPIINQIQMKPVKEWTPEEIAAVYCLLQAGLGDRGQYQGLLNEMQKATLSITSQLNPKLISSILSSLAGLKQTQAVPLVIKLCKVSVQYITFFTDEELAKVLAALTYFEYGNIHFTKALEEHVSKMAFTMCPDVISGAMQYCNTKLILSKPIFDAVAESFVYNSEKFSTFHIARQIIPFGTLNYLPPNAASLFRKLEKILSSRFSQFQARSLLDLLHSCTLLERFPVNYLAKIFNPYFLQDLQDESGNLDKFVLSQLTQLFLTVALECPFYEGPTLLPKYRLKSFSAPGFSFETAMDVHLYDRVKSGLVDLLGARLYFASNVPSPYCYTLDVEIKLDKEGFVLPAFNKDEVSKRVALCIDGQKRFCIQSHNLLGKEYIKQRHLKLLGYGVVQIPFYEFDKLQNREEIVEYLHNKIFPHKYRLSW
uniref:FAST kinase domains 3 n=1 Tax=Leptobrachium leishanense TaxID=445787 RepID=A0A8C5MBT0_9ANUR